MKVRRALLFVPGDDRHKIEKAAALDVDAVILDLEDGVAASRKAAARAIAAAALRELDFGRTERLVRINWVGAETGYEADIAATVGCRPDGYVIPKVESAVEINQVARLVVAAEHERGWPGGSILLFPIVETARGVINLRDIVESTPRLGGLMFGAEDLAGDMGATRTPDGWEVFYARSAVVMHARAMGLDAIDTPYVHLENLTGLVADAEQAHYMGYTGKLAVHPRQVEPIQRVFTPRAEEIERARRVIAAYHEHQRAGQGVFVLDGRMIDLPMVRHAEGVLARAQAAGALSVE
ncbi:MAG: HpcH/HpaI aldolase/citrate lyase family protein [Aggregatilineales bacterium]